MSTVCAPMNTNTEKTQRQLPHEKMLKRTPETEKAGRNNGSKRVRVCMSVLVVVIVVRLVGWFHCCRFGVHKE